MNKTGKMMLLGIVLATGISSVTNSWFGWGGWGRRGWRHRRPVRVLRDWRIRNNSDSALRVSNDVGSTLILQPGTDGLLPRSGSFGIFVQDLTTGQQKSFSTADGVVIFYHDYWGKLRITTRGRWEASVGWGFGPFAVGLGGWWGGRGWGRRRGYWGRRGRAHRRRGGFYHGRGGRFRGRGGVRRGGARRSGGVRRSGGTRVGVRRGGGARKHGGGMRRGGGRRR